MLSPSLHRHLPADAFVAAHAVLPPLAGRAWLQRNRDADLADDVVAALLDRGDGSIDEQVAQLTRLPADARARLCRSTRKAVLRAVATRPDLCRDDMARLLARDDVDTAAAVWANRDCPDGLRRRILAGVTCNPRARDRDRLVAVPRVDVPSRLREHARASSCPFTVAAGWRDGLVDDVACRDATVAVVRASLAHLDRRSPYANHTVARHVRTWAGRVAARAESDDLRQMLREATRTLPASRAREERQQLQRLPDALEALPLQQQHPDAPAGVAGRLAARPAGVLGTFGADAAMQMSDDEQAALATLVADRLADDPRAWETYVTLVEGFDGTVNDLLDACVQLARAHVA